MGAPDPITITHEKSWRRPLWDEDVPSRPAWFVTCADHLTVGRDNTGEPWGYAKASSARTVATRHRRAFHRASA